MSSLEHENRANQAELLSELMSLDVVLFKIDQLIRENQSATEVPTSILAENQCLQEQINNLHAKIQQKDKQIEKLTATDVKRKSTVTTLNNTLAIKNASIKCLTKRLEEANGEKTGNGSTNAALEAEITKLNKNIALKKAWIASLQSTIAQLKQQLQNAESSAASSHSSTSSQSSSSGQQIAKLCQNVSEKKANIAKLNATILELQKKLKKAEGGGSNAVRPGRGTDQTDKPTNYGREVGAMLVAELKNQELIKARADIKRLEEELAVTKESVVLLNKAVAGKNALSTELQRIKNELEVCKEQLNSAVSNEHHLLQKIAVQDSLILLFNEARAKKQDEVRAPTQSLNQCSACAFTMVA